MRSTRGLLLLAMAGILGGVAATYYHQRKSQARQAPAPPPPLPQGVGAAARDWQWSRNIGSRPGVEVRARHFRQLQDPDRIELEQVELRLYHNDGLRFDLVRCAHATFHPSQAVLYSDGAVEITMGVRTEGPQGRLVSIRASGVSFDSRTGRVATDRPAGFTFDQGEGAAVGASYDPASRELHLRSRVELLWRGRGPESRPMKLEAQELVYREADSLVVLSGWARLTRGTAVLEAAEAVVSLREGAIRQVEANNARGRDAEPGRLLEYSADRLWMTFTPAGELEKLTAEGRARLVSTAESGRLTVDAARLDLEFQAEARTSTLRRALATGGAGLESEPLARPGVPPPESRRLQSEVIQVLMGAGGKQIERVQTEAPGRIEFIPNRPEQQRRSLEAERLWIDYAEGNHVRSLRAVGVATRTEPDPARREARQAAPLETWSRDLLAEFDPKTSRLLRIEQWNDFRYREGARQARAERAVLDQTAERILLEGTARLWDESGSVAADRLELDQTSGDLAAQGRVSASRRPERKGQSSALLSNEENLEAQADRMTSFERRRKAIFEGRALLWQRANRLEAHRIEIDRLERRLTALGDVRSQFAEQPKDPKAPARRAPAFVAVTAGQLVYTEQDRLARYTGGVRLRRGDLEIEAPEIRAWLREAGADSALDHALAQGGVRILYSEPGRERRAAAENAEYYTAGDKVVLYGGAPTLADSLRGQTRGLRLTWLARDDSFEVEGAESRPALSRVRRP